MNKNSNILSLLRLIKTHPIFIVLILSFIFAPAFSCRAETATPFNEGTLSFILENDLFYGSDRNYTNGVRLEWLTEKHKATELTLNLARSFPLFPKGGDVRTSYALGQNMYTPEDITLKNPPDGDRPYAGWLYGSIGAIVETDKQLDQLEFTIGVVGPASFAEQTQEFFHDLIDTRDPNGWDTQLKNEPGFILSYQRSWRRFVSTSASGFEFDVTPHAGGALGNIFTYANAGLTVRFGQHLSLDYGPPRIQPSLPGSGFFKSKNEISWYLFAGVDGRAVARNIFLDGNTFRNSRNADRNILVGDFQFGFSIAWGNVRFGYTHVLRSSELKRQKTRDEFGVLNLSFQF